MFMKFNRRDTIWKELKEHLPFTLVVSLLAGVLVAIFYSLGNIPSENLFEIMHPAHILVSAVATAAIFKKYKLGVAKQGYWGAGEWGYGKAILIGVVGAILIGSLSDVLLPWIAGNLFSLHTHFHLPIIEEPFLILGVALIGAAIGIKWDLFKVSHSAHVFLSVFASLFYLLAFSIEMNVLVVLAISLVVFLCVYVPCCVSDIVFPILFIKKPCKDCGHWHD